MGRIRKGILGGFSGTVGNVVGGTWKGIAYMRSQAYNRNANPSELQLQQQAKFSLMMRFLQTLNALLMVTFGNYAVGMTGFNSAFGYNIKNAIAGTYPNFTVDYTKVLVSRGELPNAINPTAVAAANSKINFTWTDNTGPNNAAATDQSILVVYCPDFNQSLYVLGGAARSTGADSIDASVFKTKQVQTWLGFISADGYYISNSVCTGQVTVS